MKKQYHPVFNILSKASQKKIVVIGDIILDEYIFGNVIGVSKEAPVPVLKISSKEYKPGGAANVAVNLKAMGANVSLITLAGIGKNTETVFGALNKMQIDISFCKRIEDISKKTRFIDKAYWPKQTHLLKIDDHRFIEPPEKYIKELQTMIIKEASNCDVLIVSDYSGGVTYSMPEFLRPLAGDKPILVDSREKLLEYIGPFILKPNLKELSKASGVELLNKESLTSYKVKTAVKNLMTKTSAKALILTGGEEGSVWFTKNATKYTKIDAVGPPARDITGAGDIVIAASALGIACNASHKNIMHLASVAAGLSVQQFGTPYITSEQIIKAIEE